MGGRGSGFNALKDNPDFEQFKRENKELLMNVYKREGKDGLLNAWLEVRTAAELKNIHEISIDEADEIIGNAIPHNIMEGWFRAADSGYKPILVRRIFENPGTLNAALNVAYYNYVNEYFGHYSVLTGKLILNDGVKESPPSFAKWVKTPLTMYRGERGQKTIASDWFSSYTTNKKVAAGFTLSNSGGGASLVESDFSNIDMSKMKTIKIRPIDTWGSYQTTGELEFLIPKRKLKK